MFELSTKGDEMKKLLFLSAIAIFIIIQTEPVFCGVSKTATFRLSVTIPEHVMGNNNLSVSPLSNNSNQLVQTQTVVRDNKSISLTSIVVP